jgi:MFS family permease
VPNTSPLAVPRSKPAERGWLGLALLFVLYVFNIVDRHIVNVLAEPIKHDLGLTDAQLGFFTGFAFAIFYTLMGIPLAILADRHNRTRLVAACSMVWSIMTVATGLAANYMQAVLSRMGVGLGEAGLTPTANSLIGDLFSARHRGRALGIYVSAVPIGTMLAGWLGGSLAEHIGWRSTFIALGAFGILLTLIFVGLFREPVRGSKDAQVAAPLAAAPSLGTTVLHLARMRSCRYFFAAFAVFGFVGAAINNWTPAFFMRSHELSLATMAATVGTIFGIGGAIGMIGGGVLADRFAARDAAAYLRIPAISLLIALPLYVATYAVTNVWLAGVLLAVPVVTAAVILPPALALLQKLVHARMRAVAVSVFLLVLHVAGMGLGPLVVGQISDVIQPTFGPESLRYAILCVVPCNLIAVGLLWRGARYVGTDLARMNGETKAAANSSAASTDSTSA